MFENPLFVSQSDFPDDMKITFLNTPLYMVPEDEDKLPIPNGWIINLMLPP